MRCLLAFSFIIITSHAAPSRTSTIKMHVIQGRPVVDHVYLNGSGPYKFLLDTGAHSNQVDAKLAHALGLKPSYKVEMFTASSAVRVPAGRIAQVELGIAGVTSQEFLFTNLQGVRELSSGIQGVLGQEFLANFDYLLDFHGKQLIFGRIPGLPNQIPTQTVTGRIMTVPTSRGDLVFDSGTEAVIFFRGAGSGVPIGLHTASGFAEVSTARHTTLEIGAREYRLPLAAFAPQPDRQEAGLLPASLFRSVYVCNSGGYIVPDALSPK
jgi:hypothetical protein